MSHGEAEAPAARAQPRREGKGGTLPSGALRQERDPWRASGRSPDLLMVEKAGGGGRKGCKKEGKRVGVLP